MCVDFEPELSESFIYKTGTLTGHREETAVSQTSIRLAVLATLPLIAPSLAHAAAFQLKEDSAQYLGQAFAGSSSAAEAPSTVFDNPAGMTKLNGLQIQGGATVIVPSFTFRGGATSAFGKPISGFDGRDGGNVALVPSLFATYKITPDLAVGIAITSPFGLAVTYGPNFVGRYNADKSDLKTLNINPAIAYQVTNWLSLGAGMSAQYARAEFTSFINSSTILTSLTKKPTAAPDGYFRLKGDDWSFGYNLGALVTPGPQTNIGLAYRSRVQQDISGTADFSVPLPLSLSPSFRSSNARAKIVLPDTATLSITQHMGPNWTGYAEVNWTNWSQFKNLSAFRDDGTNQNLTNVKQNYHNSVFAALGVSYKVIEPLTVRIGTAYDTTPTSNSYRTARVPDADRVWLALGASYEVLPGVKADFGYAHVFVKDSKITDTDTTGDTLRGRYRNSIDIVSVGTRTSF